MKKKFIEVTADGKREIEEGKEPLNKQPQGSKPFPIDAAQSNYQDAQNEEEEKKKMKKKDQLEGGRADNSKPSDFDKKQLEIGIKHEMEHTKDKSIAKEIAMDHLKEDADYYSDLKEMEKSTSKRWNLIKKALSHEEAFMDIGDDEDEQDEEDEQNPEDLEEQDQEDDQGDISDEEHGHLEELLGGEDAGEDQPQEGEEDQGQDTSQEGEDGEVPEDVVEAAGGEEEVEEMSDDDLADLMKQLGHSDQEIAYVLHDHAPPATDQEAQEKMRRDQEMHEVDVAGKKQEHQIKQAESGVNGDNTKKLGEIDVKHKEKMNELEYDMTRREKEIELKFKEKELELKIKQVENQVKHDMNTSKKDADQKRGHKDEQHKKKLSEPAVKSAVKK